MDDSVNRAASPRHRLSLALLAITCASGQASAEPTDGFCASPASNAAKASPTQGTHRDESHSPAPHLILREPDEHEMPWAAVSVAEKAPAVAKPVGAPVSSAPTNSWPNTHHQTQATLPAAAPTSRSVNVSLQTVTAPAQTTPPLPTQTPMQRASAIKASQRMSVAPNVSQIEFGRSVDFASLRLVEDDSTRATRRSQSTLRPESQPQVVMPGFSIEALRRSAAKSLDEANARLLHRANLSAAAAATEALRLTAHANDLLLGTSTASEHLKDALMAIREADDFAGRYGTVDAAAISRMVNSHQTKTLKEFDTSQLTGIIAADIYLDSARKMLEGMAASDPLAAHSIALLAKSYRQRASESPLALATSVHLMRAAVASAPNDHVLLTELASVLDQANMKAEAQALQQRIASLPVNQNDMLASDSEPVIAVVTGIRKSSNPSQAQQAVRIEQISPEAFAMVSVAEAGPTNQNVASNATNQPATAVSQTSSVSQFDPYAPNAKPAGEGNAVSRAFKSMTRIWR